jgi:hypothetical protein
LAQNLKPRFLAGAFCFCFDLCCFGFHCSRICSRIDFAAFDPFQQRLHIAHHVQACSGAQLTAKVACAVYSFVWLVDIMWVAARRRQRLEGAGSFSCVKGHTD